VAKHLHPPKQNKTKKKKKKKKKGVKIANSFSGNRVQMFAKNLN
jgi:hypothetical protein